MFEKPFDRSRIYRETPSRAVRLKLSDYTTRQLQVLDSVAEEDRSEEDPSEEPGCDTGSEDEDVEA